MQIQQFLSAVLAQHANMDIGIARKVAARSAFAARQPHADNPDSHTLILTQSRPPRRTTHAPTDLSGITTRPLGVLEFYRRAGGGLDDVQYKSAAACAAAIAQQLQSNWQTYVARTGSTQRAIETAAVTGVALSEPRTRSPARKSTWQADWRPCNSVS
jgi:hypothetical protein